MSNIKGTHLRSILKAVSYRMLAAVATGTIAFGFTKRLDIALGIAAVEAVAKIICYYIHEVIWSCIKIGKPNHPLATLQVNRPLKEKDMQKIKKKLKELGYIDEE